MAIEVRIPTILRTHTGGAKTVEGSGSTLGALVDDLDSKHPGLKNRLVTEDGSLHRFVNLYVNDEDVRFLGTLDAKLGEGDVVAILPAVAGGSGGLKERSVASTTAAGRRHGRSRPACGAAGGSPPENRG